MTSPLDTAAFEAKSPRRRRIEAGHAIEARCEADEAPAFTAPTRQLAPARTIPAAFASKAFDAVGPRRRRFA